MFFIHCYVLDLLCCPAPLDATTKPRPNRRPPCSWGARPPRGFQVHVIVDIANWPSPINTATILHRALLCLWRFRCSLQRAKHIQNISRVDVRARHYSNHPDLYLCLLFSVASLDPLVARLEASGLKQGDGFTLSMSGRRALFCRDPDGNAFEFMEV